MQQSQSEFEVGVVGAMRKLYSFAYSLCKNADASNDLVQEAVCRALIHRAQYEPGTKLDAWLLTILRNCYFSSIRKASTRFEVSVEDHEAVVGIAPAKSNQHAQLEAKELLQTIIALPAMWRDPLMLMAVDGATYDEVAAECFMHVGTVKSRVHRGRLMLSTRETAR